MTRCDLSILIVSDVFNIGKLPSEKGEGGQVLFATFVFQYYYIPYGEREVSHNASEILELEPFTVLNLHCVLINTKKEAEQKRQRQSWVSLEQRDID